MRRGIQSRVPPTQAFKMEHQLYIPELYNRYLWKVVKRFGFSQLASSKMLSIETDNNVSAGVLEEPIVTESVEVQYVDDEIYEEESTSSIKRSKKRKIYCFNCNRQEFHIMAYKGTAIHSFLVGMSFGLARIFGPYRCTCCGKKRAMFADFCSFSYHWRMFSERRLSKTGRRRSSRSRSSSRRR